MKSLLAEVVNDCYGDIVRAYIKDNKRKPLKYYLDQYCRGSTVFPGCGLVEHELRKIIH